MDTHKFGFSTTLTAGAEQVTASTVTWRVGSTKTFEAGDVPSTFNHIIFDLLKKPLPPSSLKRTITSRLVYVFGHLRSSHGTLPEAPPAEVSFSDVIEYRDVNALGAVVNSGAIMPAAYLVNKGDPHPSGRRVFLGDRYHAIIAALKSRSASTSAPAARKKSLKLKIVPRSGRSGAWWLVAGDVHYEMTITSLPNPNAFKISGEYTLRRHLLGELFGLLPIPWPASESAPHNLIIGGDQRENGLRRRVFSSAMLDNLQQLNARWQFRDSQSTWIFGEPGSGKDVFANALHFGSMGSRSKQLLARSMAGASLGELNLRLFSATEGASPSGSLVEQASAGGSLFLDEFDKVKQDEASAIYGSLLRVLESKEYIHLEKRQGSESHTGTLRRIKDVNWIFAGAFSQTDRRTVPSDFWSRLTGTIKLANPIRDDGSYAETFFLYIYFDAVLSIFEEKDRNTRLQKFLAIVRADCKKRSFTDTIVCRLAGIDDKTWRKDQVGILGEPVLKLAHEFGKLVHTSVEVQGDVDSTRAIRQAARTVFFELFNAAINEFGPVLSDSRAMERALWAAQRTLGVARGHAVQ